MINKNNYFETFKFLEFVNGSYKNRNENSTIISINDIPQQKIKNEAYYSMFIFDNNLVEYYEKNRTTKGLKDIYVFAEYLWIDVDNNDLIQAKSDTIRILQNLETEYNVDINEYIEIFFSGKKGFHIGIPSPLFDCKQDTLLPIIFKKFAKSIAGDVTIDMSIYNTNRLLRFPGSAHPDTEFYKTSLTFDELTSLSNEEICNKSREKSEYVFKDISELNITNPKLSKLFKEIKFKEVTMKSFSNYPCIRKILSGVEEGSRHNATMILASDLLLTHNVSLKEAQEIILEWNNNSCKPPREENDVLKDVKDVEERQYRYSCNHEYLKDLCSSECPKKQNTTMTKRETTFGMTTINEYFMICYLNNELQFIVNKKGNISFRNEIRGNSNVVWVPRKLSNDLENGFIYLPSAFIDHVSDEQLLFEIAEYIRTYFLIPEEECIICSLWAMGTWVYDLFSIYPYLHVIGQPGTGKTTLKNVLHPIVFLGQSHSSSSSSAALFRAIPMLKGTLLSDEIEFTDNDTMRIFRQGFERGNPVTRVNSETWEVDRFDVYCPKFISTIEPISDFALSSRCISIRLDRISQLPKSTELPTDLGYRTLEIRNKLVAYRFSKLISQPIEMYNNPLPLDNRTRQTFNPIYTLTVNEDVIKIINNRALRHSEVMNSARSISLEGLVVEAIINAKGNNGKIYCSEIARYIAHNQKDLSFVIKPRKVGSILDSLEIPKERDNKGFYINKQLINKRIDNLAEQFGLNTIKRSA